jgi:putative nucleotidyltransferase with HDIG domain
MTGRHENHGSKKRPFSENACPHDDKVSALILAAGYSKRMGVLKPTLKIGDKTLLERVVRLFRDVGIEDVIVVVGHAADQTIPIAQSCKARVVMNGQFELGMFSSIQAGVNALSPACDAFFVLPVDIPLVRPQTILDLLEHYHRNGSKIILPVFLGKKGHPPLVSACYRNEILAYSGDGGLRAVLANHEAEASQVHVADEMILLDLDTPADYEALLERFHRYDVPTPRELNTLLLHKFRVHRETLQHSKVVAGVALRLAAALIRHGARLDMELILAAAMLHDIAKGRVDHAFVGAEMISEIGFSSVARVVAAHTNITVQNSDPVDEREVVYLADKLVQGYVVTFLQDRFEEAVRKYRDDPVAYRFILDRFDRAEMIRRRFEAILGVSLESTLTRHMDEPGESKIQSLLAEAWRNTV